MTDQRDLRAHTPLIDEGTTAIRMSEVIEDVARRLRGVCAHMPEHDFRDLMREIAEITVKYEQLASGDAEDTMRDLND